MADSTVGFIGAGILGKGLALALSVAGYTVAAVSSRTDASARDLASRIPGCSPGDSQQVADGCGLVFITTPDDVIGSVAQEVRWREGQGVVHCNGTHTLDVLAQASGRGALAGAFHPFQTFGGLSTPEEAAGRLRGATFSVDAPPGLRETLEEMAGRLGGRAVTVEPGDRPIYHTSAALSSGYLVSVIKASADLWGMLGASQEEALATILPLARATLDSLESAGVQGGVTGPLVRADEGTLRRHLEALQERAPALVPLYCALARESLPLARERVGPERAQAVDRLLREFEAGIRGAQ